MAQIIQTPPRLRNYHSEGTISEANCRVKSVASALCSEINLR